MPAQTDGLAPAQSAQGVHDKWRMSTEDGEAAAPTIPRRSDQERAYAP